MATIPVLRAREKPQSWADIASGLVQGFGSTYIPKLERQALQNEKLNLLSQLSESDAWKSKDPLKIAALSSAYGIPPKDALTALDMSIKKEQASKPSRVGDIISRELAKRQSISRPQGENLGFQESLSKPFAATGFGGEDTTQAFSDLIAQGLNKPSSENVQPLYAPTETPTAPGTLQTNQEPLSMLNMSDEGLNELLSLKDSPNPEEAAAAKQAEATLRQRQTMAKESLASSKFNLAKSKEEERQKEHSYKEQKDFIDKTTNAYSSWVTDTKPKLLYLQQKATDKDLISPTSAVFLEQMGIPLGALESPASEAFQKVSQDLMKGLPETYGNKIMKIEVENFLKTIPTLMNSAEGRRLIATNMLKLGEMKAAYYNGMRQLQTRIEDSNAKYPRDFQQRVLDQVMPTFNRISDEFRLLSTLNSVPKDHTPLFTPDGSDIVFVPNDQVDLAIQNKGKKIW